MTQRSDIRLQLLPHECAVLQKRNTTPDVQDQLEALAPDVDVAPPTSRMQRSHAYREFCSTDLFWSAVAEILV